MPSVKLSWIKKYGEVEGLRRWDLRKKLSACSLNSFVLKHGEVDGISKYESWKRNLSKSKTLAGYVERYGESIGFKRYKEKNSKLSVSVNSLKLSGKSDDEIEKIRKKHSVGSTITHDTLVEKYGLVEGSNRWNLRIDRAKISSKRSIEYWLLRNGGDEKLAKLEHSNYQRRDKHFYIEKYGSVVGLEKYNAAKQKRFLGGFAEPCSKFQIEVESYIRDVFGEKFYGHSNCYALFLTKEESMILSQSIIIPDVVIESEKLIIECFGDYWHGGDKFDENHYHAVIKKTVGEIRMKDEDRIKILKNRGYRVEVVWEGMWNSQKDLEKSRILYEINKERNQTKLHS